MRNKNKFYLLFTAIVFIVCNLDASIVRRAALDIGSGETKLTVADIDTDTNKIVKVWYQNAKTVELRKDLAASPDGFLSKNIQEKLINTLKEMKTETSHLPPQKWFGVSTSVFRTAKNGQELLDRIKSEADVTIHLIPQIEEGEIGFLSAVAASKMNPEDVIAWDSGSGSFQISTLIDGQMEMYGAEFAFVPALEALFANRKQPFSQDLSPNPISTPEASELVRTICNKLPPFPIWLKNENNKQLISIGGKSSIFSFGEIATGQSSYTREQIWEAILNLCGSTDEELSNFPEPQKVVVGLILLYSVMDHCAIDKLTYFQTNGGCEGILINQRYWKDEP